MCQCPHQVSGDGAPTSPAQQKHHEQPVAGVTFTQLVPRQSFEASFRFTVEQRPSDETSAAIAGEKPSADDQQVMASLPHNDSKHSSDIWRLTCVRSVEAIERRSQSIIAKD